MFPSSVVDTTIPPCNFFLQKIMNFVQQKSTNLPKHPPRSGKAFERNACEPSSVAGPSGMVQKFFQDSTTGFHQAEVPPPEARKTKKGIRVLGSGQSYGFNSDSHEPHVILVITEGRNNARGEIGMASVDMNCPTLTMSQFSDDLWYTGTVIKIQMLEPAEIVVPNTVYTEDSLVKDSTLIKVILKAFPNIKIKPILRKFFNDVDAMNKITELCSPHCESVKLALEGKYYALTAAGGLFRYLQTILYATFAPESLQIVYEAKYGAMMIDVETSKRLELVASLMPRKSKNGSLYQYLDKCQTNIGKRSLRARILAPLCDVKQIREFQEAVQELVENPALLDTLKSVLKKFRSVDKMQRLCFIIPQSDAVRAAELMISHVITVKSCLESLPQLNDILATLTNKSFESMRQGLEDPRHDGILQQIGKFISDGVQMECGQKQFIQRIHAVKEGCNVFLDITRKLYYCLLEDLKKLVTSIGQKYELSLQLAHNCTKGYHVVLITDPRKPLPEIPEEFEVLSRRGSKILLRNEELINMDLRIRNVINEILIISNQVLDELLQNIRKDMECFYMLAGVIVEIDLLQNFASLACVDGTVCPTFGADLKVIDGIHPFLEFGHSHIVPVPNNIIATSDYNFFLITGPNMGGKTVYIKMIAILQIMAQIGAFIPATEASFRICDKLFSRMGFDDTIQRGVSNFHHEVQQSEYIKKSITPNSLVIVDELGRSTNPHEGKIWAWAMCEELADLKGIYNDGNYFEKETDSASGSNENGGREVKKLHNIASPFVFLTTHFKELTKLPDYHYNMVNLYLEADEEASECGIVLKYTHKVKYGVTPLKAYGLALAKQVRFSRRVVPRAEEIFKKLESLRENPPLESLGNQVRSTREKSMENERKLYDLYANLASFFRPDTEKKSDEFIRKEIAKIMKKFIDDADPQFIVDLKSKPPPRALNASTTTTTTTTSRESNQQNSRISLNLETIREDLRSERTITSISNEFQAILNSSDQLRRTYTITTTPSPPPLSNESVRIEEIPRSAEKIEEIPKAEVRKPSSLINFNIRAPYRPRPKENLWEMLSSKHSPNSDAEKPLSGSSRCTSGKSSSIDHRGIDLFERDRRSSADFLFSTPGPSRKRPATEDAEPILNLSEDEDEIQTEYDRMFLSQLTSTQDNILQKAGSSEEFTGLDISSDKELPEKRIFTQTPFAKSQKTSRRELDDFFGDPVDNSNDPWVSEFANLTQQSVLEPRENTRERSKESSSNRGESSKTSTTSNRKETTKSSSGDLSEISSITPVEKPQFNFMEQYRENVIRRMQQQKGPLKPIRAVKQQKKSLVTKLPQTNYPEVWKQRQREIERFTSIAGPSNAHKSVEKEAEKPKERENFANDSSSSQMSVCTAKVPWFPDIGTLAEAQTPKEQPPREQPQKKERLVLDLAKLNQLKNSKL
ncbi:mutS protein homolog 4-like [Lutzomyia longipalpis]|uniref:mutS protein homolog 4-like n=1 Tax=Lutzomyia longipalpis TaxID=7200 RepID=UPI0024836078|nr:mutS protein homolog 4-like [Lutzomyia longipalpis]